MRYFSRAKRNFGSVKKAAAPVRVIVVSFVLLILAGTFLLTLPVSSAAGGFTHPLDALFTATSATCVTGLSVVDTTSYWSPFGQAVLGRSAGEDIVVNSPSGPVEYKILRVER